MYMSHVPMTANGFASCSLGQSEQRASTQPGIPAEQGLAGGLQEGQGNDGLWKQCLHARR